MEEDIKILEKLLGFISVLNTEQRQALENLIEEYKRLKNDNAVLMADMIRKSIAESIPKSKIKYVIEHTVSDYSCLVFNLEKLMEEE